MLIIAMLLLGSILPGMQLGSQDAEAADMEWATKANMPTVRSFMGAGVVDGKIYTIGGYYYDGVSDYYVPTVEMYDPATDTWAVRTSMPKSRSHLVAGVVDGKIYAIGGYDGETELGTVQVYDPLTNDWSNRAGMPTPRHRMAAGVVGGKIYVIGGSYLDGSYDEYLSTVEMYDPATDTWAAKADMPTPRRSLAAGVVGGKIYAIGGSDGTPLSTVEMYDPATNKWAEMADLPKPRSSLAVGVIGGSLYVFGGGSSEDQILSEVLMYSPGTNTWAIKDLMQTVRYGLAVAVADDKAYAIGGINFDGATYRYLSTVEEYASSVRLSIEVSVSKQVIVSGEAATVTSIIKNIGTVPATNVQIDYYYEIVDSGTRAPTLFDTATVSLDVGAQTVIAKNWTAPTGEGNYTISVGIAGSSSPSAVRAYVDDGDGIIGLADAFPGDPDEWADSDGDGIGDNSDSFPDIHNTMLWALIFIAIFFIVLFTIIAARKLKSRASVRPKKPHPLPSQPAAPRKQAAANSALLESVVHITVPDFIDSGISDDIIVELNNTSKTTIKDISLDLSHLEEDFEISGTVMVKTLGPGKTLEQRLIIKPKYEKGTFPVKVRINSSEGSLEKEYKIKVGGTEIY